MGNKRKLWLVTVIAVVGIGGIVLLMVALSEREPEYQGRSLGSWLENYQQYWRSFPKRSQSPAERNATEAAVRSMGTNALPILLRWVQAHDAPLKVKFLAWADKHPRFPYHPRPAQFKNEMGAGGLRILGATAQPAVPELVKLMRSSDTNAAVWAEFSLDLVDPFAAEKVRNERVKTNGSRGGKTPGQ